MRRTRRPLGANLHLAAPRTRVGSRIRYVRASNNYSHFLSPQRYLRLHHAAALIANAIRHIGSRKEWAIEVYEPAQLSDDEGRSHGERRASHAADHELQSLRLGSLGEPQRFRESPRLIELDVNVVILADHGQQRCARLAR